MSKQSCPHPDCDKVVDSQGRYPHWSGKHPDAEYDASEWVDIGGEEEDGPGSEVKDTEQPKVDMDEPDQGASSPQESTATESEPGGATLYPDQPDTPPTEPGGKEGSNRDSPRYTPQDLDMSKETTPTDILEKVLAQDPKLGDDETEYILSYADLYGTLSTGEVQEAIKELNISKKKVVAQRVAKKYVKTAQRELDEDPSLKYNDEWSDWIFKETGHKVEAPDDSYHVGVPAEQRSGNGYGLDVPSDSQPSVANSSPQSTVTEKQVQGMSPREIVWMFQQLQQGQQQRESSQSRSSPDSQTQEALRQTMNALESIEQRLNDLEQDGGGSSDMISDKVQEAVAENLANQIETQFNGGGGNGEMSPQAIQAMIQNELSSVKDEISTSDVDPGQMNQYDMEVQKAKTMADARIKEAEQKSQAIENAASAIAGALNDVGYSIGQGAAEASTDNVATSVGQSAQPGQTQTSQATMGDDGSMQGPCTSCGSEVVIPEGKARTTCDECGEQMFLQPNG